MFQGFRSLAFVWVFRLGLLGFGDVGASGVVGFRV